LFNYPDAQAERLDQEVDQYAHFWRHQLHQRARAQVRRHHERWLQHDALVLQPAAQQVSPLLLRIFGSTLTLTGLCGRVKLHWSPLASSV
jgi:hypothetical protein